jgi:hypothetical protein
MTLAAEIAEVARRRRAPLAVLPAGYLFCENVRRAKGMARALAHLFGGHGVSLLAGIDVSEAATQPKDGGGKGGDEGSDRVANGALPYFFFATNPAGRVTHWWRQRSTTSSNASLVPRGLEPEDPRTICVGGVLVALVACGEIFNPALGKLLAVARPDLVVDLGHLGMGRGFQSSFPRLAQTTGAPIISAQHVAATTLTPRKWRAFPDSTEEAWTLAVDSRVGTRAAMPTAQGLWAELLLTEIEVRSSP